MTAPAPPVPLRTVIRDQYRTELTQAGIICRLDASVIGDSGHDIKHVRVAAVQAARLEKISVKLRTIDGTLHARRLDMTPAPTMPGLPPAPPTTEDYLISLSPWPDDDQYTEKTEALKKAIEALR